MPLWVAGIGIGILAILIFLWRYPWGISSGYGNWGNQLYYYLGFGKLAGLKEAPLTPWIHPVSVMNIGMILGATGASMMKGQFSTYLAPRRHLGPCALGYEKHLRLNLSVQADRMFHPAA